MAPRWKWDFEDEQAAAHAPARPAPGPLPAAPAGPVLQPPSPRPARLAQVRRRRSGAVAVVVAIVVVLAVILTGSHHGAPKSGNASAARRAAGATPIPTPDPQAEANAAVSRVLGFTPFVRAGGGQSREIALTFDDGPGPYTPQVLDVLERHHVRATFFAIGRMERYFSASTVRQIRDGDVVGDHTESHPQLAQLSAHDQHEELFEPLVRIEALGGDRPTLFRPPYGSYNAATMRQLRELKLLMVLWSADTEDYQQPGVSVIVQRALEGARPGAILLMHDGGGDRSQTIAALPTIISRLRAQGYRLVTVPELLLHDPPPAGQPLPLRLGGD